MFNKHNYVLIMHVEDKSTRAFRCSIIRLFFFFYYHYLVTKHAFNLRLAIEKRHPEFMISLEVSYSFAYCQPLMDLG